MKTLLALGGVAAVVIVVAAIVLFTGVIDVAADNPHSGAVFRLLETARERSIAARIDDIETPALEDPEMIRRGAGNYDSMCAGCHLAPGMQDTELSLGLYPAPPKLAEHAGENPARAFWVIKHGVKATGMPAWGKSMEDRYIWDMVAFLRQLPTMTAEQYAAEVAASGGHAHGGGETTEAGEGEQHAHSDESAAPHSHEEAPAEPPAATGPEEKPKKRVHTHADGQEHEHQ